MVKVYPSPTSDNKGNILHSNLTPEKKKGPKSLVERVKQKEIVVQKNDKGGDLALYNPETFVAAMEIHHSRDSEVSWEDHNELELELNASTIQTARILRVGEKWNHWARVKSAVVSHAGPISLIYGYPKTHKDQSHLWPEEQEAGPPVRPVCGSSESSNGPTSDLLSEVISQLGDIMDEDIKTLYLSIEEMCGGIEKVNKVEGIKKPVILSMDVVKMFPSLSATQVTRLVKEEYRSSNLKVEVDEKELGLGLAILLGREELVRLGLGEVTCRRKKKEGRPIKIPTNWVVAEGGGAAENLFHDPDRQPTDQERRHMMSLLLEQIILMVMRNHVYSFNGVNKLQ